MPPLRAEKMFKLSPEEIDASLIICQAREAVYKRMRCLLPEKPQKRFDTELVSAKAVYSVDGQPEGEFTRAWLRARTSFYEVHLITDRVIFLDGELTVIKDSEFIHFALGKDGGPMYTDYYLNMSDDKNLELMQTAQDTLDLIEQANIARTLAS
jgi:hypothetical protein